MFIFLMSYGLIYQPYHSVTNFKCAHFIIEIASLYMNKGIIYTGFLAKSIIKIKGILFYNRYYLQHKNVIII